MRKMAREQIQPAVNGLVNHLPCHDTIAQWNDALNTSAIANKDRGIASAKTNILEPRCCVVIGHAQADEKLQWLDRLRISGQLTV